MSEFEKELGWDDVIEKESDFTLLPAGDYDFTITGFERARHEGSEKLPPCNKAVVSIHIDAPEGSTTIQHNLFLHSKCEGMLSAFFIGISAGKYPLLATAALICSSVMLFAVIRSARALGMPELSCVIAGAGADVTLSFVAIVAFSAAAT